MNTLPVRRSEVFLTLSLTGLIPLLLCQLLAALLTSLLAMEYALPVRFYLQWFAVSALSMIAFFGFAVFCAMLTGSMIIMPAVYVVLNLTAAAVEYCVRYLLKLLIYGYSAPGSWLTLLSPVITLVKRVQLDFPVTDEPPVLLGLGCLAVYCAVGLIFAALALWLYQRRHMESVTDIVAIPVLKPIFRVCMGFGTALVFADVVLESSDAGSTLDGSKAAMLTAVLLVIGAVLGWLAAEMLIRRTVRVFPFPWKGLVSTCLVLLAGLLIAEADLSGYERRLPDLGEIESVEIASYDMTSLKEAENIEAFRALHERLIQEKSIQESENLNREWAVPTAAASSAFLPDEQLNATWLDLCYRLKNGKTLSRTYRYLYVAADVDDPETTAGCLLQLLNTQEAIDGRMSPPVPLTETRMMYAAVQRESIDGNWYECRLTYDAFMDLWENGLKPDAAEKKICLYTLTNTENNLRTQTSLSVNVTFGPDQSARVIRSSERYWNHTFRVFTFSEHTLAWIEENLEIDWQPLSEVYLDEIPLYPERAVG